MLERPDGELRTRGETELGKDVADVPLSSGLGDDKLTGDGAVAQSARH